jgi:hypothetical protein
LAVSADIIVTLIRLADEGDKSAEALRREVLRRRRRV